MKKNLVFKLGLFCAALVLIATCFVSSAWAKYTKTVSATDTARVALFKVGASINNGEVTGTLEESTHAIDIFRTTYANVKYDKDENADEVDIIAPGSNGSFTIKLENDSEVAVSYELSATFTNASSIPLYFKVGTEEWVKYDQLSAKLEALDKKIAVDGADVDVVVQWAWFYDADHADSLGYTGYVEDHEADTDLGELGLDTFVVTITCVATQDIPA